MRNSNFLELTKNILLERTAINIPTILNNFQIIAFECQIFTHYEQVGEEYPTRVLKHATVSASVGAEESTKLQVYPPNCFA